jgi:hypothetical protein
MRARRLPDGRIRIPVLQVVDGNEVHGTADIGLGDPRFKQYDEWLSQQEQEPVDRLDGR